MAEISFDQARVLNLLTYKVYDGSCWRVKSEMKKEVICFANVIDRLDTFCQN